MKNGLPVTISSVKNRLDKDQPPLPDPKANIHGNKILLRVWWDNSSQVFKIKFNDYCEYVRSAAVKSERKTLWKASFFYTTTRVHVTARTTREKILQLRWPDHHLFCSLENFSNGKFEWIRLSKISSSPNHQLHFTTKELTSCQEDGTRSYVVAVNTS